MGPSKKENHPRKRNIDSLQPYPLALMGASLPPPHVENPAKQKRLKQQDKEQSQSSIEDEALSLVEKRSPFLDHKRSQEESDAESANAKGYVNGPLDPIFGQHKAFPVNIDISDLDESKPPSDVNSYLARVRLEAEKMDVVAFVPRTQAAVPALDLEEREPTEAEEELIRWHLEFMEGFVQRREQFEQMVIAKEALVYDFPKTMKTWRTFMFNNDPSDEYALALDTVTILKLINYSTKWLSKNINAHFANWVILLLVIVPDVLEANDMSTLRSFAKKALRQRADELNEHEEVMRSIISAVGDFFGQRDLLEGYLAKVSGI